MLPLLAGLGEVARDEKAEWLMGGEEGGERGRALNSNTCKFIQIYEK